MDIEKLLVRVSEGVFGDDVEPDFTVYGPDGPEEDRYRQLKTSDDWKVRPLRFASPLAERRELLAFESCFQNGRDDPLSWHALRRVFSSLVVEIVATALLQLGIELMERT